MGKNVRDDPAPRSQAVLQGIKRKIFYVGSFELFAIAISSTLLKLLSGSPVASAGTAAVASSAIALLWNLVYNGLFERWEARQSRKGRSLARRAAHALGFEAGLVLMLVPLFAWVLDVTLREALLYNLGMIAFFLAYTFLFNLAFDRVFGLPISAQGR
ncbi:MAG: bacterial Transrane Pair family protein [Ramlibacter sp.]|nr:bacterial Transrane Pair family protein [Ramlibacter sp.]